MELFTMPAARSNVGSYRNGSQLDALRAAVTAAVKASSGWAAAGTATETVVTNDAKPIMAVETEVLLRAVRRDTS
ncbi:hypothetical protein MPRF_00760 [Mycolicibacterium parafortuitum]|uniref:Uncharacterized protein n=1 Tax=Mycolicibacterium parafortuitum TaxID=39692 RepID=A0A7I7TVB9_MYCPF|nr:hypothetical protein MPRF_00760 [Mycolicibacterium parafortuitum]